MNEKPQVSAKASVQGLGKGLVALFLLVAVPPLINCDKKAPAVIDNDFRRLGNNVLITGYRIYYDSSVTPTEVGKLAAYMHASAPVLPGLERRIGLKKNESGSLYEVFLPFDDETIKSMPDERFKKSMESEASMLLFSDVFGPEVGKTIAYHICDDSFKTQRVIKYPPETSDNEKTHEKADKEQVKDTSPMKEVAGKADSMTATKAATEVFDIWSEFNDNPRTAEAKYKGKKMRLSAYVDNTYQYDDGIQVFLRVAPPGEGHIANATFGLSEKEALLTSIRKNPQITFEGTVEGQDATEFLLVSIGDCRLLPSK